MSFKMVYENSFKSRKDIAYFTSYLHRLCQMSRVQIDADESVCLCWHLAVLNPCSWFLRLLTSKRQHNLLYLYCMPCTGGMIIAKVCQLGKELIMFLNTDKELGLPTLWTGQNRNLAK